MKKFEKKFKEEFLKELNAPNQNEILKEKLGIESNKNLVFGNIKETFFSKLVIHKKIIIALTCFILLFIVGIVGTTSYIGFKNKPVYEGMEVTSITSNNQNYRLNKIPSEVVNANSNNSNIKDVIDDSVKPVLQEGIAYYAEKGETIEIIVKISNPKSFEILSFTLNGRLYQTYEFKEGSNSEQIVVSFICQDESGIQLITIDAIKYVEGTTIKNARFDGDRTLKIGVKYNEVPVVSNLSEIIETTFFETSFFISDLNNLVDVKNGLMMYFFDGKSIIKTFKLKLGMNVVTLTDLYMKSSYEYAIVAVYDQLDGRGKCAHILSSNKFTTKTGIEYKNIEVTYDSILFNLNKLSNENITIEQIALFDGYNLIETANKVGDSYIFNNLLSNKEYIIQTKYSYQIIENNKNILIYDTIEENIKTKERPIPSIEFVDVVPSAEGVSFNLNINDSLSTLGKVTALRLYKDGNLINVNISTSNFIINGLLSNNTYEIEVEYTYDLQDGNLSQKLTKRFEFTTLKKNEPKIILTSCIMFGNQLTIWFEIDDPDNIVNLLGFDVYNENGEKVASKTLYDTFDSQTNEGDVSFNGLINGESYIIYVVYSYDLNDGSSLTIVDQNSIDKDNSIGYNK